MLYTPPPFRPSRRRVRTFAHQHKPGILERIKTAPTLAAARSLLGELLHSGNYARACSKTRNKALRLVRAMEAEAI